MEHIKLIKKKNYTNQTNRKAEAHTDNSVKGFTLLYDTVGKIA